MIGEFEKIKTYMNPDISHPNGICPQCLKYSKLIVEARREFPDPENYYYKHRMELADSFACEAYALDVEKWSKKWLFGGGEE